MPPRTSGRLSKLPVLVLTQRFDPTADYVVTELHRRGAPVFRCDPGEFPQQLILAAHLGQDGWRGGLRLAGREVRLDEIGCAYYRRPSRFEFPDDLAEKRWAAAEARMGLGGVLAALPRWLNHPVDISRAEYKPVQLAAARVAGLRVPDTLITNDPEAARRFASYGEVIYKPLSTVPISGGRAIYTTPITAADNGGSIVHTAHLFQQRLVKRYEIRATYVDGVVHAARVDAASAAARVDWRADYDNVTYTPITITRDLATAINRLMQSLRLRFGALDLVVTPDDRTWFLEVNPNGQWAFVEDATGLPITASIADALQRERS